MKDVIFEFYIGDTYSRDFVIEGYTSDIDNVYFTVKKADDDREHLIQKELDSGITLVDIQYESDGTTIKSRTYNILLYPNDTEDLQTDIEYPFDIEIVTDDTTADIKKTIIKGVLILDSATTRFWDE